MRQQTMPMNQGSTSQPATGSSMNRTDGSGASGLGNRTDSMAADGRTVTTERVARADRN
jgi:S-adenosylmethionine synthetase